MARNLQEKLAMLAPERRARIEAESRKLGSRIGGGSTDRSMKLFPSEKTAIASVIDRVLSDLPRVRSVTVFGSRARGAARPDSDLDIALHMDGERDARVSRAVGILMADLFANHPHLSLSVVFDEGVDPLRDAIAADEVVQWKKG